MRYIYSKILLLVLDPSLPSMPPPPMMFSSVLEAYRPVPNASVRVSRLLDIRSDTTPSQLALLGLEPWYRRRNLTGLTIRCSFNDVSVHYKLTIIIT